jgi:hypothetical protein
MFSFMFCALLPIKNGVGCVDSSFSECYPLSLIRVNVLVVSTAVSVLQ